MEIKETTLMDTANTRNILGYSYGDKTLSSEKKGQAKNFVCFDNGKPVGYLVCQICGEDMLDYSYRMIPKGREILYITTVFVNEGYDKSTVIKMLMREALNKYREDRHILVPVWINGSSSEEYIKLLTKFGFVKVKEINNYWWHRLVKCSKCGSGRCSCSCWMFYR